MKKIMLTLISIIFMSCATTKYAEDYKIIKFKKFDKTMYDWYSTLDVKGSYCVYLKHTIYGVSTNHIYGDFQIIPYNQYLKEK